MAPQIPEDHETVMFLFRLHRDLFPHIRTDTIKRGIKDGQVILENDVVITYQNYKLRQTIGTVTVQKGDCVFHQIASETQGNGALYHLQDVMKGKFGDVPAKGIK